ncbi:MAG TPA: nucleoside hydrolase [Anaerolineales bacterium]|nr:nucleoside hydrolase [Anaerolineales bacterium]
MTHKVHLDTDLGGDIDDLCALAMLLHWEDVEITGITTVAEAKGRRAGYIRHILGLESRNEIPVAAGADVSEGYFRYPELGYPDEARYWTKSIPAAPNPLEDALQLLKKSIEQNGTIIAIGPYTNLYLLDSQFPGILKHANVFLMGGYVYPIRAGFPQWSNEMDWNIQLDVKSAKHVLENSSPTLIPLSVTAETALRRMYLDDLRKSGPIGELIAQQAEAYAIDEQNEKKVGEVLEGPPNDIINFQHDGLACAIALGWNEGVEIEELPLVIEEQGGWLHERVNASGKLMRVVTRVDGPRFNEFWLDKITRR